MALLLPKLISQQIHNSEFIQLCSAHHIEGLLYSFYPEFKENKSFKDVWIQNWHRNELAVKTLQDVFKSIKLKNAPVLLKGSALLGSIYKDIGSRFMSDIDLLIHPDDFSKVEHSLKNCGYRRIESTKWKANNFKSEWALVIEGTEVCIELHSKLYYHAKNSYEDFIFEKSHIDGFLKLAKIDQFIHLSTHYVFQHTFQKIYWAFDLYFYATEFITLEDIPALMERSKLFKVTKSTQCSFEIINKFFGTNFPVKSRLKITHDFLWSTNRSSLEYFKIKHQTKDSLLTAIEYDFLNLFSRF